MLSPLLSSVDAEHMAAVEKIPLYIPRVRFAGCNLLDQARSALVTLAQGTHADVYVWLDSDIIFDPRQFEALAAKLTDEYPIVSALYPTKDEHLKIIGTRADGEAPNGLVPASRVGFGFVATRAKVFDVIGATLPTVLLQSAMGMHGKPYFHPIIDRGLYLGEDYSFCLRAERAGIKMAFAPDIRVAHKGAHRYQIEEKSSYQTGT